MYSIASAFTFDMVPGFYDSIKKYFRKTSKIPIIMLATQGTGTYL
jgi:hypothetical protein